MAFSGTEKQRGPIISDAILVMGMKYDGEDTLKRRMYSCPMLPKVKRKFYEYQISGAADSLVKSFGTIPLDGAPPEHVNDPEIQAALGRMKTIPLHSHINADQTGLGKTIQELLAHAWMVEYSHERDSSGQRIYRPTLVNVPKSVIDQWVKEISRYWKNLEIAIAYGDSQSFPSNLEQRVVTATSMRDRFAKDGSRKPLPARFEKMLDQSNPDAARFIMPTTYDTFRSRCSWKVKTFAPAQSYDPPQYNEAGREVLQPRRLLSIVYQTGWVGVFRCVILDEGHRIRNYDTASNAIMEKLRADVYWVVTATPIVTWPLVSRVGSPSKTVR